MNEATPVVFVVDDDDPVRESVMALLSARGFIAEGFGRADDFLHAVAPARRGCVLLDVRLPDMTGLEVLARLSQAGIRLPVVMITAYGDVPLAVAAMRAGATDFLEKPYEAEQLIASIGAALQIDKRSADVAGNLALLKSRLAELTPREREVLELLVGGKQNKQIAYDLGISPRTVEIHRGRVMEKMRATSISQLVRMVIVSRTGEPSD